MATTTTNNKISIIGLGRLGLCTALCFERKGYDILGVDLFPEYCEKINNKTFSSPEPQVEDFLKASKNLKATTKMDEGLEWSDMIFILVDTPTGVSEKSYDHSKLSRVLSQIVSLRLTKIIRTNEKSKTSIWYENGISLIVIDDLLHCSPRLHRGSCSLLVEGL